MSIKAIIETDDDKFPVHLGERVVVDGKWYKLDSGDCAIRPKSYRDRVWLVEEYHTKGKTLKEIADACGVSPMTINQWLVRHNIPSRPRGRRKIE